MLVANKIELSRVSKLSDLDVRLGSEYVSVKFRKIISFRIMSKISMNCKDKALARTELRHIYLP